ncbi:hypothetical protein [Thermococcus chitonophagus]
MEPLKSVNLKEHSRVTIRIN